MAAHQSDADLLAGKAVAKVDVAQIAAIVALVVGNDAQLLRSILQILQDLIDPARMHRTGRNIHHPVRLRHVQSGGDGAATLAHDQFDPRPVAQSARRRHDFRNFDIFQRRELGERRADQRPLTR